MNIIAICGSPRRGNTEFMLRRFLTQAEELGHKTELVLLREKRIERCSGCMACEEEGKCNIKDDMGMIIERLKMNDVVVFGSPVYFSNVTGLLKDFFDRMDPLYDDKPLRGKHMIAVLAGAQMKASEQALRAIETMANSMEMDLIGDLYLMGKDPRDVEEDPDKVGKIDEFVNNILNQG